MPTTTVVADPFDFEFDPATTALMMIDFQRDFVEPQGFGELFGNDVVVAAQHDRSRRDGARKARASGLLVIHTREGHRPDLTDCPPAKLTRGGQTFIGTEGPMGRILVRGEHGHDIIPELYPIDGEPIIDKPGKGSFYATDLDLILQDRGIRSMIFCGVTTEVCVQHHDARGQRPRLRVPRPGGLRRLVLPGVPEGRAGDDQGPGCHRRLGRGLGRRSIASRSADMRVDGRRVERGLRPRSTGSGHASWRRSRASIYVLPPERTTSSSCTMPHTATPRRRSSVQRAPARRHRGGRAASGPRRPPASRRPRGRRPAGERWCRLRRLHRRAAIGHRAGRQRAALTATPTLRTDVARVVGPLARLIVAIPAGRRCVRSVGSARASPCGRRRARSGCSLCAPRGTSRAWQRRSSSPGSASRCSRRFARTTEISAHYLRLALAGDLTERLLDLVDDSPDPATDRRRPSRRHPPHRRHVGRRRARGRGRRRSKLARSIAR